MCLRTTYQSSFVTMKFNKDKFISAIQSCKSSLVEQLDSGNYWKERQAVKNTFLDVFKDCVSFESPEERNKILDYMRQFGVQEQIERDFSATRQVIDGNIVFLPAYENWSAGEMLAKLLTYRNSSKLSQKTVQSHRDFIYEVARQLFGDAEVQWVYKEPQECEYVIDRGYSLATFPIIGVAMAVVEATADLVKAERVKVQLEHSLSKSQESVNETSKLLADYMNQLQAV